MDGSIATQPISITHTLDLNDVIAFTAHSKSRMRLFGIRYATWTKVFKILVVFVALIACWQIYSNVIEYLNGGRLRIEVWLPALGFVFFGWFYLPIGSRWRIKKFSEAHQKLPQDIQLLIDDSGVGMRSNSGTSHVPWTSFVNADETKDYFLLYQAKLHAVVIPKRAIAGDSQISDVRKMIKDHVSDFSQHKV